MTRPRTITLEVPWHDADGNDVLVRVAVGPDTVDILDGSVPAEDLDRFEAMAFEGAVAFLAEADEQARDAAEDAAMDSALDRRRGLE